MATVILVQFVYKIDEYIIWCRSYIRICECILVFGVYVYAIAIPFFITRYLIAYLLTRTVSFSITLKLNSYEKDRDRTEKNKIKNEQKARQNNKKRTDTDTFSTIAHHHVLFRKRTQENYGATARSLFHYTFVRHSDVFFFFGFVLICVLFFSPVCFLSFFVLFCFFFIHFMAILLLLLYFTQ